MNDNLTTRLLWLFAVLLLVVGIGMTVQNFRKTAGINDRFRKKIGELKVLRSMQADLARYEAARQKMDQLTEKHPVVLNSIIQEVLSGVKVDDVRESRKDLVAGWAIRQKEVSMNDVPVGTAVEFIRKAESQKLPWCLAKCIIRTSPNAAGTGQIILLMEAVEKNE